MTSIPTVAEIATLHEERIIRWKKAEETPPHHHPLLKLVDENHAFNYKLWHAEDRARRDDSGYEFVYRAKRDIDHYNQQRNNRMESMDEWFFNQLQPASHIICPVHSETPGMMIDRLSILALKSYHMAIQTTRPEVDHQHRQSCQVRLDTLKTQQHQLQDCLAALLHDTLNKTRTFRVYHQFKMYNDPALNPELY